MPYYYWELTAIDDDTGERVELGDLYFIENESDPSQVSAQVEGATREDLGGLGYSDFRDFYICEIYYDME